MKSSDHINNLLFSRKLNTYFAKCQKYVIGSKNAAAVRTAGPPTREPRAPARRHGLDSLMHTP